MTGDRISGLFWLLFGVFIIREGIRLGIGRFHEPGPGFMTLFGGVFVVLFSALLLIQSVLAKPGTTDREVRKGKENPWVLFFILLVLIIYVLIFEPVGFIISTFLLVTFLLRFLEQKKWWKILLTAGVVSISAFIVFNVLLNSGLPEGILKAFP